MCLIIHAPTGTIPKNHLKTALTNNPDGWGYMFLGDRGMVIRRGLWAASFWKHWKKDKKRAQGRDVLFHARFATHGTKSIANTHPFRVGGRKLWMMHNGVLDAHGDDEKDLSDTRHFMKTVLSPLPGNWLDNGAIRQLLAEYCVGSKLAFMDNRGQVTIINEGAGVVDNGRWYSNAGYKPYDYQSTGMGFKAAPGWAGEYDDTRFACEVATCPAMAEYDSFHCWDHRYFEKYQDEKYSELPPEVEGTPEDTVTRNSDGYVPVKHRLKQLEAAKNAGKG